MCRMIELAERCEAATGPDRDLDGDIHALLVGAPHRHQIPSTWPFYTASLDAAMSLVPEGCVSHEQQYFGGVAYATIFTGGPWREIAKAKGKTKALAMTAAALRACAATQGEEQ